jgi:radical SAM protein with 4Fe4S-binding SPASM domain
MARTGVGVDINGDLYLCHRFVVNGKDAKTNLIVGNILTGLDDEARKAANDKYVAGGIPAPKNKERCKVCAYKNYCMGCCIGVNLDTEGTFNTVPDTYCDLMYTVFNALAPIAVLLPDADKKRMLRGKQHIFKPLQMQNKQCSPNRQGVHQKPIGTIPMQANNVPQLKV